MRNFFGEDKRQKKGRTKDKRQLRHFDSAQCGAPFSYQKEGKDKNKEVRIWQTVSNLFLRSALCRHRFYY